MKLLILITLCLILVMYYRLNMLKTKNKEYDINIKKNHITLDSLKIIKYD